MGLLAQPHGPRRLGFRYIPTFQMAHAVIFNFAFMPGKANLLSYFFGRFAP